MRASTLRQPFGFRDARVPAMRCPFLLKPVVRASRIALWQFDARGLGSFTRQRKFGNLVINIVVARDLQVNRSRSLLQEHQERQTKGVEVRPRVIWTRAFPRKASEESPTSGHTAMTGAPSWRPETIQPWKELQVLSLRGRAAIFCVAW